MFDFKYDGPGMGKSGTGVLTVDGKVLSQQEMEHTIPFLMTLDESFDIGMDTRTPVDDSYKLPFRFAGTIDKLTYKLGPEELTADQREVVKQAVFRSAGYAHSVELRHSGRRRCYEQRMTYRQVDMQTEQFNLRFQVNLLRSKYETYLHFSDSHQLRASGQRLPPRPSRNLGKYNPDKTWQEVDEQVFIAAEAIVMAGLDRSVEASLLRQLLEQIHLRLRPHRHTVLLAAIIAAFLVRPLVGDSAGGAVLFSSATLVLLLLALYNIDVDELVGERETLLVQRRKRSIIAWTLGIPAIAERMIVIFSPSPSIYLAGSILWLLLFAYITCSELRAVLKQKEVTREVISMSISTYLLFGLTFGLFYILLHDLQPNAFSFGAGGPASEQQTIPVLIYFSLTTLSTIGFGDITPVTLQARYAAVAEGITGQFYLAILVARLVGMQMSPSTTQHTEQEVLDSGGTKQ